MSYKLNIKWKSPEQVKADKLKNSGLESPVGNWKVTTEGDEEGRSTTDLGIWYGHVAEIAFHLADKCFFALYFKPVDVEGVRTKSFEATKKHVNIGFRACRLNNPFEGRSIKSNMIDFGKWLDADGVRVDGCSYYGAVTLVFEG